MFGRCSSRQARSFQRGRGFRRLARAGAVLAGAAGALVAMTLSATTASAASWASQLLRYPWLTDMTSSSVVVMWASSISSSGSVQYGPSPSCSGKTVTAARNTITVGSKTEYQWKATMSGLSAGASYCYRVYNGSPAVGLLGCDPSPTSSALPPAGPTSP